MPNGHVRKEYGPHQYDSKGTSNCANGCGCWMGDSRSGGPVGLDPFGACPNNPIDGVRIGGATDYTDVVEMRIEKLEGRARIAETKLAAVDPEVIDLAGQVKELKEQLRKKDQIIETIRTALSS